MNRVSKVLFSLTMVICLLGCTVPVNALAAAKVTGISLDKITATVNMGKTIKLTATCKPKGSTSTFTWTTSDSKVATVSKYGSVKGIKAGTATITAKTSNGKKATCKITVKKVNTLANSDLSVTMEGNKTIKVGMTLAELKKVLGEPTRTGEYPISYNDGKNNDNITAYTWQEDDYDLYVIAYISGATNKSYRLMCGSTDFTTNFGVSYGDDYDASNKLIFQRCTDANINTGFDVSVDCDYKYGDKTVYSVLFVNEDYYKVARNSNNEKFDEENTEAMQEYNAEAVDAINIWRKSMGYSADKLAVVNEKARLTAQYRAAMSKKYNFNDHTIPEGTLNWSQYYRTLDITDASECNAENAINTSLGYPVNPIQSWISSKGHRNIMEYKQKYGEPWISFGIYTNSANTYLVRVTGPMAEFEDE